MVVLGEENDQSFANNELDERVYRHYKSPQLEWLFLGWNLQNSGTMAADV